MWLVGSISIACVNFSLFHFREPLVFFPANPVQPHSDERGRVYIYVHSGRIVLSREGLVALCFQSVSHTAIFCQGRVCWNWLETIAVENQQMTDKE
jgi:hypothetical protein